MKELLKRATAALLVPLGLALLTANLHAQDFVYVNNNSQGPNSVSAFSVGSVGALTSVSGSPFLTGGTGIGGGQLTNRIAVTTIPGNFLYASNDGSNNISGFSIDNTTGALKAVPGSPFAAGALPGGNASSFTLAVDPIGQFLYVGTFNISASNITAFKILSDGALTPVAGSPFAADFPPFHMKGSPDGKFLSANAGLSVSMFSIASDGALTPVPGSPFDAGGGVASVDINCGSSLLFAAGNDTVSVLNIAANGVLTPIAGSPFTFSGNDFGTSEVLSPDDRHLFVGSLLNNLAIVSLNVASGGSLTQVSSFPFPAGPFTMATNQAGTLLYVTGSFNVSGFSIDSNGVLSPVAGSPFSVSAASPSLTVFPPKACFGPPTGLHATVGNQTVDLLWNPSPGSVDSYNVYRDECAACAPNVTVNLVIRNVPGTNHRFSASNLVNGQLYRFTVTAVKNGIESLHSSFVLARPGEFAVSQPPPKPANPVLFLHGILSDASTWNTTGDFLRKSVGWNSGGTLSYNCTDDPVLTSPQVSKDFVSNADFYAVNFGQNLANYSVSFLFPALFCSEEVGRPGLLHQADEVQGFVRELTAGSTAKKVTIVAHSMGGMAARRYIADHATDLIKRVSRFITYGTPHWGASANAYGAITRVIISLMRGANDLRVDCTNTNPLLDYTNEPSPFFLEELRKVTLPSDIQYFAIRGHNDIDLITNQPSGQTGLPCLTSQQWDGVIAIESADLGAIPAFAPIGQTSVTAGPVPLLTTNRIHTDETSDFSAFLCALDPNCYIATVRSPVDIEITAPDGRSIARQLSEIPGASYMQLADETGHRIATVMMPFALGGDYTIKVVPKPGVSPTDTYTLEVTRAGVTTIVAQNQRVEDIPAQPYIVTVLPPLPIDIKPGGFPNSINLGSTGTIPVAILSTTAFNAPSRVDKTSLTFGRTGNEHSLAFCNSGGEDVNGDGLLDLVCHFNTGQTDFTPGDSQGVLKGKTVDGVPFVGTDPVRIVTR